MSVIHAIILLFLWLATTFVTIKNIEEFYKMKKPLKKRNERIVVASLVFSFFLFRGVISSYMVYFALCNLFYFIGHIFVKNKYLDKSFYLTFIIPILIVIYGIINCRNVVTTTYTLTNSNISEDIKIAFISDVHLSTLTNKKLDTLVDTLNKGEYDCFIIGGDLIDEFSKEERVVEVIKKLGSVNTKYGIYYIEGNHDLTNMKRKYYLTNNNINVLLDESVLINDNFYLVGRRDKKDEERTSLDNLISDLDKPIILLDHQPNKDTLNDNVIIQLSGHTHAGQLWPLDYFVKYGYYEKDKMIVSSGFGAWHNPVRTAKHSEIIELIVKKA